MMEAIVKQDKLPHKRNIQNLIVKQKTAAQTQPPNSNLRTRNLMVNLSITLFLIIGSTTQHYL